MEVQNKSLFTSSGYHDEIPCVESLKLARTKLTVGAKQFIYVCVVLCLIKLTVLKAHLRVQFHRV